MWESIKQFVIDLWDDLAEFIKDVFADIFAMVLGAIATVIEAIPAPDFMNQYSLGDFVHADVAYFLAQSNFHVALGVISSAYLFYFLRRVLTMGIW